MGCHSYQIPFPLYGDRGLSYTFGEGPPTIRIERAPYGRDGHEHVVFDGDWDGHYPPTTGHSYFACERTDGCIDPHDIRHPDADELALMALVGACVVLAAEDVITFQQGQVFAVEDILPTDILKSIMAHFPDASDHFKNMIAKHQFSLP